jgi:membrane protease YdiL (CAAX protease family)
MSGRDLRNQRRMNDELQQASAEVTRSPGFRAWFRPPFKNRGGLSSLQFMPLYLFAGIVLFLVISIGAGYLLPARFPRLWGEFFAEVALAAAAILPACLIATIEQRPFGLYGLSGSQAFGKHFWAGVAWGTAAVSVLLCAMRLTGAFYFGDVVLRGARLGKFAIFWAVFFLCVALFEEFAFRGYALFAFSEAAGFWPSALLLAVIFGYTHRSNPGESWMGAMGAGVIGLFFAFTRLRTGSLWFAVGMHASWDWAQTFIYGVPDSGATLPGHMLRGQLRGPAWLSGGSVGPEGSALLLILIAILWVAFDRLYPARRQSAQGQISLNHFQE